MFIREDLEASKRETAIAQMNNASLRKTSLDFIVESDKHGYAYQWTWLGLPVIQLPQDIVAVQEIIWKCKPDVIVETGIAWGGSVILYASILQLIGKGKVVGIDLNLYDHVAEQIGCIHSPIELICTRAHPPIRRLRKRPDRISRRATR